MLGETVTTIACRQIRLMAEFGPNGPFGLRTPRSGCARPVSSRVP